MDHREHSLAEVVLGRHEDVLAVEEPCVRVEAPLQELCGLLIGGCGRTDVVEEVEGRPGNGVELRSVIRAELAVAAGEGVRRGVEAARAILHGEVEPEQLAEPLVLWVRGQPLVEEVLQAVVVGADQEAAPPEVGPPMPHSMYQ